MPASAQRDRSCLASVSEVKQKLLKGSATLVDVRSAAEFDRYRIPGSLNIPAHLIKTKLFLKTGFVVLIDEGRSSLELQARCKELRNAGFGTVSILHGGLYGWYLAHEAVAGDAAAWQQLDRMPASEMFIERSQPDWLLVDLTDGTRKDVYAWLPSKREQLKAGSAEFAAKLRTAIARRRQTDKNLRVVIVAANDSAYDGVAMGLRKGGVDSVFYLAGGIAGYDDFLRRQVAIWNQKDRPQSFPSCRG